MLIRNLAHLPLRLAFWLVVLLCFAAPLAAIAWQLAAHPRVLGELWGEPHRLRLLAVTVAYNAAVAALAASLALPAAVALGRGANLATRVLWILLPVSLLLPTITFEYGWKQAFRLAEVLPAAQSPGDVARCIWTLACWLWPIPAAVGALALRRADPSIYEQAALDGALGRVTLRMLLAPVLAASAATFVLASQEFAVFEPTGIRVVAAEVRMVFESGAAAVGADPIARDQPARVAAAIATAAPLAGLTMLIAAVVALAARRWATGGEAGLGGGRATAAGPSAAATVAAFVVVGLTVAVPIVAMVRSLSRATQVGRVVQEFAPQLTGSLLLALGAMAVAIAGSLDLLRRPRAAALVLAAACFLAGGQMLAIVMIWIYNRDALARVYDSPSATVLAYVARFGWVALAAAAATWTAPWRGLRDLAAADGASASQAAYRVVLPLAWPMLAAAAVLVGVLSLTEVPATMLIGPLRPQPIVPMLMTWIHLQQYDPMIEGTLLLSGVVVIAAALVVGLAWVASKTRTIAVARPAAAVLMLLLLAGCRDPEQPRAIWLQTGIGSGQVVYPRAIDYRPQDDSYVVIDRMARVQRIDSAGKFITAWRMPDFELGKPVGVTVGPDGNIYVPDTHYQRVIVYAPDGKEIRRWGKQGTGPGEFIFPTDVAFDARGRVFVSEYGDHDRIQVFDDAGKYLYEFGSFGHGDGQFSRPQSMVIRGELVYVTDACNHRIVVFTTDGRWVRNIGGVGTAAGQFRFPYGLAADAEGRLIVCEFGNNRVQRIGPVDGASLGVWGRAGRAPGELAYPWAVAVGRGGDVAIVDAGNNRVQVARF